MVYLIFGLGLLGLGAFVALQLRQTDLQSPNWFPKCMMHQATGLHCVGCGATRAVQSILRGDLLAAIRFNPALVLGGPLIGFLIWRRRSKERLGVKVTPYFCWYVLAFVIIYSAARNIPSPETSWFAPPEAETVLTQDDETPSGT